MTERARPGIVALHRGEDLLQVAPRRSVAVEAMKEQHVRDQARHPVDARGVADHRTDSGCLEEIAREALAALSVQHTASREVDQIPVAAAAIAFERLDQGLRADISGERYYGARLAVEGEVVDRRIEELALPPHYSAGAPGVIGEPFRGLDEAVRDPERRTHERRHRLEESLHREALEQPLVPVGLKAYEFRRRFHFKMDRSCVDFSSWHRFYSPLPPRWHRKRIVSRWIPSTRSPSAWWLACPTTGSRRTCACSCRAPAPLPEA